MLWLAGLLAGLLAGWLAGWLAGLLACWLAGWLAGCAGWLAELAGWLAARGFIWALLGPFIWALGLGPLGPFKHNPLQTHLRWLKMKSVFP